MGQLARLHCGVSFKVSKQLDDLFRLAAEGRLRGGSEVVGVQVVSKGGIELFFGQGLGAAELGGFVIVNILFVDRHGRDVDVDLREGGGTLAPLAPFHRPDPLRVRRDRHVSVVGLIERQLHRRR